MVKRIDFGRRPDGSYGIRHSIPSIDVDSAGLDQFIFNSDWGATGLIHTYGEGAGTSTTITFADLGYTPLAAVFVLDSSRTRVMFFGVGNLVGPVASQYHRTFLPSWRITQTTLVSLAGPVAAGIPGQPGSDFSTYPYRYYIFKLPGT